MVNCGVVEREGGKKEGKDESFGVGGRDMKVWWARGEVAREEGGGNWEEALEERLELLVLGGMADPFGYGGRGHGAEST